MGAACISEERLAALTGSKADLTSPHYQRLKEQLAAMKKVASAVRFCYLLRPAGEKVVFLVDSEPTASNKYPPPGQVYDQISPDFLATIKSGTAAVVGPYKDRGGNWVTAAAGVHSRDGHLLATLAIDMEATGLALTIARTRLIAILMVLIICGLLILFYAAQRAIHDDGKLMWAGEERFLAAFTGASIGMSLLDKQGRLVQVNPALQKMLGYSQEEFAGRKFTEFSHPDDLATDHQLFQEIVQGTRGHYQIEKRFLRKDGQVAWGLKTISVLRDQAGQPQQALGIIEDISQRKRAEEYLQAIMATIQAGVLVSDQKTGRITHANPVAARLIGHAANELIGDVWTRYIPEPGRSDDEAALPSPTPSGDGRDCHLITAAQDGIDVRLTQASAVVQGTAYLVQSFLDISDLKRLLAEQQISIELSSQILQLVNRRTPRHIDLDEGHELFIEAISVPCKAAGGDHYLVRTLAGGPGRGPRTIVSVKDQSGHEVNCILRSIVTDLIHHSVLTSNGNESLEHQMTMLNDHLCQSGLLGEDHFLTSITVEIDHATRLMRYCGCGHPPMLLIRGNQVLPLPYSNGLGRNLPVGIIADASYTAGEWKLEPGDRVLMYTDGLTEMPLDRTGSRIDTNRLRQMVGAILEQTPNASIGHIVRTLLQQITELSYSQVIPGRRSTAADDVTIVGLEVEPSQTAAELVLAPNNADELANLVVLAYRKIFDHWQAGGFSGSGPSLRLVLEEALTNAWKHGNREKPRSLIRVGWRDRNDFSIDVIDSGGGFSPANLHDPRTPRSRMEASGRGIFMMKNACDSLRWKSDGRHLVAAFAPKLHPEERRRSNPDHLPPQWW